ncbi:sodium:solute symporter family transporter [Paraneptunicella aestuarii]|uniref:sodium:solute symporter family transporter n=1 Tax=Paraneptunicella aestuarii TaxID=2831148 RepID=UPI001E2ABB57|nr:sodium/solute symporter [Paraneptunicella aestuarii]
MNILDYVVVVVYLAGLLGMGYLWRSQHSEQDYFLGGKSLGWFPLTLSTMATQLSAISFISAPAFVGMREGGGLQWLAYEFAVPLAMILVALVILPALYRSGVVSIYDFLERRYGSSTRYLVSFVFQVVRSFGTGIAVYAVCIILQAMFDMPMWMSIVVVGIITLVYSTSGGMKAVVYGDVIQMVLIFLGLILVAIFGIAELGGAEEFWNSVDPERFNAVNVSALGFSNDEFGLLPMIFGGFVLYASYYGCDQTQAQRAMSAKNVQDVKKLLFANGILRFPLVLLYCITGLIVGVVVQNSPELLAQIPADKPDYMMPVFILQHMPNGVIGLLLVAILSAAMSSLSSTVNSLAAVTLEDLNSLGIIDSSNNDKNVVHARYVSLFWGLVILVLSSFADSIAPTVIEAINKVGSALYGPILGVFLMAMTRNRVSALGANVGLLAGMFLNLYLWVFQPQIFWMWWNFIGLVVTVGVAFSVSLLRGGNFIEPVIGRELSAPQHSANRRFAGMLVLFFLIIVAVSVVVGALGQHMAN